VRLPPTAITYYNIAWDVEIHRTARKHGIDDTAIRHALDHAITVFDLEPDADPPKVLAIGPDPAGNLLEIIWLELEDVDLVIHAMPLRAQFYDLLPQPPEDMQ
jgi:hypothetical protein